MAFGLNADAVAKGYELSERHFQLLETQRSLLEQIANGSGPGVQTLAIAEQEVPAGIEVDFPVEGSSRWIIPRLATGGSFEVPSTGPAELLAHNNRRLGGTIVNRGNHDLMLILASAQTASAQAGLGEIFLSKEGGSWDFRLGSLLWCGSVCGIAVGEDVSTVATIVEV